MLNQEIAVRNECKFYEICKLMGNTFDHILGEFSADLSTLNCRNPQICADTSLQ